MSKNKQIILKNIYSVNYHNAIHNIKNIDNELEKYLKSNYIISDIKIETSGVLTEYASNGNGRQSVLVIEIYLLEKDLNL